MKGTEIYTPLLRFKHATPYRLGETFPCAAWSCGSCLVGTNFFDLHELVPRWLKLQREGTIPGLGPTWSKASLGAGKWPHLFLQGFELKLLDDII